MSLCYSESRDSSVGIALGYGLDDLGYRVRFWFENIKVRNEEERIHLCVVRVKMITTTGENLSVNSDDL
jgi:hypothetical protein